jgi:cell division protein FtsI/penicillin-binding protein 2
MPRKVVGRGDLIVGMPRGVDALRNVLALQDQKDPEPGSNVVLTIDAAVQRQLQESLAEGLSLARRSEMEERVQALEDKSIPERIREAYEEARAEQAEALQAQSAESIDDPGSPAVEVPAAEPVELDEGEVLGPLYRGLPIDEAGVCVPVERIDLDLDPETQVPRSAVLSGTLQRAITLDSVEGEDDEDLVAVLTIAGESYRLGVNDRAATPVRVVAITGATEEAGPSVVIHHQDKYCPVRSVGVVLDPNTGAVIAMASNPTFEPSAFVGGLSHAQWRKLGTESAFTNFAVQGQYAPASTMKTVAFVMAMEEGVYPYDRSVGDTQQLGQAAQGDQLEPVPLQSDQDKYLCSGFFEFPLTDGSTQRMFDWRTGGHGPLNLHEALRNSCDLYFWDLAFRIWQERGDESGINNENLWQEWARRFGFDAETGVDLPFERSGLIPDRDWFRSEQEAGSPRVRSRESGGWVGGDLMNAIVGEGAVLTTPLQLANAYATMVNGGTLYEPYVVAQITDQDGAILNEMEPTLVRDLGLSPRTVASLRADLAQVVNHPEGTADRAFADFGPGVASVGGKTGTGEVIKASEDVYEVDNAWFVGIGPVFNPRYVVAIVVERGGSGGAIAAPIVRQMLQYLLLGPDAVAPQKKGANAD